MRFLLILAGVLAGGTVLFMKMRDKPMVREQAEKMKHTAAEVGGAAKSAASDLKDTAKHEQQHAQAA